MESGFRSEKISVRGPEYEKEREYIELQRESYASRQGLVFGRDYVDSKEKLREAKLAGIDPSVSIEKIEHQLFLKRMSLLAELNRAWSKSPNIFRVLHMFRDLYDHPLIKEGLKKYPALQPYFDGTYIPTHLFITAEVLSEVKLDIPEDFLDKIADCHIERFDQKIADFESFVEHGSREFIERVQNLVKEGRVRVDLEEVKKRVAGVKYVMTDGIGKATEDLSGSYIVKLDTISLVISSSSKKEAFSKYILFHELFHLISGRTLITTVNNVIP